MTVGTGKFISRKVSRVRWLPQQDTSQLESSTLVTGSWDDEVSITLASHWSILLHVIIPAPDWLMAGILVSDWQENCISVWTGAGPGGSEGATLQAEHKVRL